MHSPSALGQTMVLSEVYSCSAKKQYYSTFQTYYYISIKINNTSYKNKKYLSSIHKILFIINSNTLNNTFFMKAKDTDFSGEKINGILIKKLVGQGNWADVYLAQHSTSHQHLAVKTTSNKKIKEVPKLLELIKSEISILRSCNNINVVRLIDEFVYKDHQFMILEYCNGLQLGQILVRETKIDEPTAISYLKQILNGFKGLHQVKAMHRDFKVQNVMLHDHICKIVDLGFGKQLLGEGQMTKTKLGSNFTMAPQVMQGLSYDFKADIWSIGVVFYQMLFGKFPFQGRSVNVLLEKAKKQEYNLEQISQQSKDFIKKCLRFNPQERISWKQIYRHPLIVNQELQVNLGPSESKLNVEQNAKFYQTSNVRLADLYPSLYTNKSQSHKQGVKQRVLESSLLSIMKMNLKKSQVLEQENVKLEQERWSNQIRQEKLNIQQPSFKEYIQQDKIPQMFRIEQRQQRKRLSQRVKDIKFQYDTRLKDIGFMSNYFINQMVETNTNNPQIRCDQIMACLLLKQSYLKLLTFIDHFNFQKNIFQNQQNEFLYFLNQYGSIFGDNLERNSKKIKEKFHKIKSQIKIKPQQFWLESALQDIGDGNNFLIDKYVGVYISKIEKRYNLSSSIDKKKILKLSFTLSKFKKHNLCGQFSSKILLCTLSKFNFNQAQQYLKNKCKPRISEHIKMTYRSPASGFFSFY